MRTRFVITFCLIAVVAVTASALVTLYVGGRASAAEADRRLATAASFALALLDAERDRNRSDALEIASRQTVVLATQQHDAATLERLLGGLRQTLRDDLVAVYAPDGSLLAADMVPELRLDEPVGVVRAALSGAPGVATTSVGGRLVIAGAAPILQGNDIIGAVLTADHLDERFARRVGRITDLTVIIVVEGSRLVATDSVAGQPLSGDDWTSLRTRGEARPVVIAAGEARPAIARPLSGPDNRPVAGLVIAVPAASLSALEPRDIPLYAGLTGLTLIVLCAVGIVAGARLGQPNGPPTTSVATPKAPPPALTPAATNGSGSDEVRRLAGLLVDRARRHVAVDGRTVQLTPTEFELIWFLAAEPGRVVGREALLEHLRGADWQAEPGLVDTHVSNLRRKLEPDPARPRYLITVRGVGYKLNDE